MSRSVTFWRVSQSITVVTVCDAVRYMMFEADFEMTVTWAHPEEVLVDSDQTL